MSRSSSADVDVEVGPDGSLLVSVESRSCSLALSIDPETEPDDVEQVIRDAYQETRHTRGLGRSDA